MADLQNFTMTRNGNVSYSIPRFNVTCTFTHSSTGETLGTFNGTFPSSAIMNQFTAAELEEAFKEMYLAMVMKKAQQY